MIAVVAAACVSPTTFGTVTGAGPVDTTMLTADAGATLAPASGLWLITLPDGTVALCWVVTVPSVSPAPVIAVVAAACVRPTTLGTSTNGVPLKLKMILDGSKATVRSTWIWNVSELIVVELSPSVPRLTEPLRTTVDGTVLVTVATAPVRPGVVFATVIL